MVQLSQTVGTLLKIVIAAATINLGCGCAQRPAESAATIAPSASYDVHESGHGSGVVLLDLDYESGRVTGARILESTGNPQSDAIALKAFLKWHFKPRSSRQVRVPVTLTLVGGH